MTDGADNEKKVASQLERYRRITLDDLAGNLQDRYDEKYIIPVGIYAELLSQLETHYRVLEVNGVRDYNYISTYLDLPDFPMYIAHHNGKKTRYKVRFRRYVHSGKVYLEVKHKINKGKTLKKRIGRREEAERLEGESRDFIRQYTPFDPERMAPVLRVSFSRITLASPDGQERITYDHGLHFRGNEGKIALEGFGVMEIKHSGRKHYSPMTALLTRYRIMPGGFSKYCTGIGLLYPGIKYNRFKPMLKTLKEKYYVTSPNSTGRG